MKKEYPEKYELPICATPPVTTNFIGLQYSVFEAYKKDLSPILANHYINVTMGIDTRSDYAHIYDDNWLEKEGVMTRHHFTWHKSFFEGRQDKLTEPMIGFLCDGYYICGNFNARYISAKPAYNSYDTNNAYLIYGYDLQKKVFLSVGRTNNSDFEKFTMSFDEYAAAVSARESGYFNWNLVKFNENIEIKTDLKRVYNGIYDYVNSKSRSAGIIARQNEVRYGLDCYRDVLKRLAIQSDYRLSLDPLGYQILKDHHVLMQIRIDHLLKSNIISDKSLSAEYRKVLALSERIYGNYVMYNKSPSPRIIAELRTDVSEMLETEPAILNRVLAGIKVYLDKCGG